MDSEVVETRLQAPVHCFLCSASVSCVFFFDRVCKLKRIKSSVKTRYRQTEKNSRTVSHRIMFDSSEYFCPLHISVTVTHRVRIAGWEWNGTARVICVIRAALADNDTSV